MCEYCGCKEVPHIGELMAEHVALLEEAERISAALRVGARDTAIAGLQQLVDHLHRHVQREEAGVFAALRSDGDFADEVLELEGEHRDLDAAVAALDPGSAEFDRHLDVLFRDLAAHIEREDLGVFPVSVVTLGALGWDLVAQAHQQSPSFLSDPPGGAG